MTTDVITTQDIATVATQPGGALVATTPVEPAPFLGYEDYDGSEFRLPQYGIAQMAKQMTEWGAKAGQFHNSITGENKDELDNITILSVSKAQWYGVDFTEAEKLKAAGQEVKAWCKSSDGKLPDADIEKPQAAACAACPRFKGQRLPDGSFEPPACTKIRKVLFSEEEGTTATITVRKGACQEIDNFVQPFAMRKKPLMSVRAKITTFIKKGNGNEWYVASFKARFDQPVSEEEQQGLAEVAALYKGFMSKVDDTEAHGDEQPADPSAGAPGTPTAPVVPDVPDMPKDLPTPEEFGF